MRFDGPEHELHSFVDGHFALIIAGWRVCLFSLYPCGGAASCHVDKGECDATHFSGKSEGGCYLPGGARGQAGAFAGRFLGEIAGMGLSPFGAISQNGGRCRGGHSSRHDDPHDFRVADLQAACQGERIGNDFERGVAIERSWWEAEVVQRLCARLLEQILRFAARARGSFRGQSLSLFSNAIKKIVGSPPLCMIGGELR